MAEEKEVTEGTEDKLSFKTADELTNFLMDLQGQLGNLQQIVDKLSPVEDDKVLQEKEEDEKEELSDDEISEIDKLLQSE